MENKRWAKAYPELGTGPLSTEPYISPEYFELEREQVFRRTWINVGRVEDVPKSGDYVVRDIAVCKASILIVRGKDEKIRAFHNVCPHRGNQLVWDEKGSCRGRFRCEYHAWTFDMEGELRRISDEENFHGVKKKQLGLTPVHLDIWEGFLFIHLAAEPAESLEESLGDAVEMLAGLGKGFEGLAHTYSYHVDEAANWKVALDAQNEVYHLPFQHRRCLPKGKQRYTRLSDLRLFKSHSVWCAEGDVAEDFVPKPSELEMFKVDRGPGGYEKRCELPMIGSFDFYVLFPNFVVLLFRGHATDYVVTYNFWPLAVDRTDWEIRLYFPPAQNAGQRLSQEFTKTFTFNPLKEDTLMHEKVFAGLSSRAVSHIQLQDEEIQLRHFYTVWHEHMGIEARE